MSSVEGAEEAAKDAADIATFFKSGKPEAREAALIEWREPPRGCGTLFMHCLCKGGWGGWIPVYILYHVMDQVQNGDNVE